MTSAPAGGSCVAGTVNGTAGFNCTTSTINPGATQTFTYTANMPTTFTGNPGGSGCSPTPPTQYPVRNVVVLASGGSDDSTVCVNASPAFDVTKSVTTNPPTNPPTTSPGGVVTYTITVKNTGTAAGSDQAKDSYDPRVTISGLPAACSNNTTTHVVTCNTGTLNPGQQVSFSYQATMPATFSGPSGGSGCQPGQYPVINTVVVTGDSATVTVCVTATPNLTLAKSANVTSTGTGGTIVHTLTYNNTGKAEASGVSIVEDLRAGTAFASCTGGCTTNGPPVTRATWNIGSVPAGAGGSVTLTVTVTATEACQICNTAKIASPDFNGGNPVSSNEVCIPSTPGPNPAGAHASGDALGAQVQTRGLIGLETIRLSESSSSQSGVGGPQIDSETVLAAAVPSGGAILSANVLRTTSAGVVTASPAEARETSTAEVLGVCILPIAGLCTVESSTVRAVASTVATGSSASHSDAGSTIENLRIAGIVTPVDLNAPLTVNLSPLLFGPGSYVAINQRQSSVTTPPGASGGTFAADLTVTMIRVHITGLLFGGAVVGVD